MWKESWLKIWDDLKSAWERGDWIGVGKAILDGIVNGLTWGGRALIDGLLTVYHAAIDQFVMNYSRDGEMAGNNIIWGIIDGIYNAGSFLRDALINVAQDAWDSFTGFWDMHSPSGLGEEGGANIVSGIEKGILGSIGSLQAAMQTASLAMVAPLAQAPSAAAASVASAAAAGDTTTNSTTNNFNLAINSSADTEPIAQDFAMLQSLAGV